MPVHANMSVYACLWHLRGKTVTLNKLSYKWLKCSLGVRYESWLKFPFISYKWLCPQPHFSIDSTARHTRAGFLKCWCFVHLPIPCCYYLLSWCVCSWTIYLYIHTFIDIHTPKICINICMRVTVWLHK